MREKVDVLISKTAIIKRIEEMAEQINEKYAGEEVFLLCVLKGGVVFMVDLAKKITVPATMSFMSVSSYGDCTESSGHIKILMDLDESVENKNVIIVEDIIDSGRTLSRLYELIKSRSPKSIEICTLLDKPERRVADVQVDYTGFAIPDEFVVGYGLDYSQRYRNLDYIGVITFIED